MVKIKFYSVNQYGFPVTFCYAIVSYTLWQKFSKYLINEILLLKPYQSSIRVYNLRKFSFPYFQNGQLKLDEDSWMGYATKFFTSDDPNDPSKYYFGMH